MTMPESLRARCWGTRGSVPSPGPTTAGYGGNTSCLEVMARDGRRFIFDAGSGIRLLGQDILAQGSVAPTELFLTHFHWDHIQGLPFFAPMYVPEARIRVHGAKQGDIDIQSLIAGQMGPIYFPIPFEAVAAQLEFKHLNGEPFVDGDVEVASMRVRHPGWTHGYRIRVGGSSVGYFPDNELVGGTHELSQPATYKAIVEFLDGVDLLFHDAMFSDTEYTRREGWGHSSFGHAVRLAEEAGVKRLMVFHHAPERTDTELFRILGDLRDDIARRGSSLEIGIAAEGEDLTVEGA